MFPWTPQQALRYGWNAALAFARSAWRCGWRASTRDRHGRRAAQAGRLSSGFSSLLIGAGWRLPMCDRGLPAARRNSAAGVGWPWVDRIAFCDFSLPTLKLGQLRPRSSVRWSAAGWSLPLPEDPWWTLAGLFFVYLALMPVYRRYAGSGGEKGNPRHRSRRRRPEGQDRPLRPRWSRVVRAL